MMTYLAKMNTTGFLRTYSSSFLLMIRTVSRVDYSNFHLTNSSTFRVISLGIRKQPMERTFHRSRAEKQEYISSKNVDVCAMTETWLKKDDALTCKQIPPPGYKIHLVPRQDSCQGGGIAIV